MNEQEINKIIENLGADSAKTVADYINSGDWDSAMEFILSSAPNDPYVRKLKSSIQDQKESQFAYSVLGNVAKTISDVYDIKISADQIKEFKKQSASLKRPAGVSPYQRDPMISEAIRRAQVAGSPMGIESQLSPLKQDIADNYSNDLGNARISSGGQSGLYGAYSQAAINRRLRGSQDLQGMRSQLRSQADQSLLAGISLRQRENEASAAQDRYRAMLDNQNYQTEATRIGQLGAAGRLNLRNSIRSLSSTLPNYATIPASYRSVYGNRNQYGGYAPNNDFSQYVDDGMKFDTKFNIEDLSSYENTLFSNLGRRRSNYGYIG